MSNIDFSAVITAEDKLAAMREQRERGLQSECSARILAVCSYSAQRNMADAMIERTAILNLTGGDDAAATAASSLSHQEALLLSAGRLWRADMLTECRAAVSEVRDPVWPAAPDGLFELAQRF